MYAVYTVERQIKVPDRHRSRLNITQMINEIVAESGIQEGNVTIQTRHTTTGLIGLLVQEDERGLIDDLLRVLDRIAPEKGRYYQHDDFERRTENIGPDERKNAAAHIKASLLQTSLVLIFKERQLTLGPWQSVLFFDFDPEGRPLRDLIIQVCGEKPPA